MILRAEIRLGPSVVVYHVTLPSGADAWRCRDTIAKAIELGCALIGAPYRKEADGRQMDS